MQHRQAGEVRDAGDGFQRVEAGDVSVSTGEEGVKECVFEEADGTPIGVLERIAKRRSKFGGWIGVKQLLFFVFVGWQGAADIEQSC